MKRGQVYVQLNTRSTVMRVWEIHQKLSESANLRQSRLFTIHSSSVHFFHSLHFNEL